MIRMRDEIHVICSRRRLQHEVRKSILSDRKRNACSLSPVLKPCKNPLTTSSPSSSSSARRRQTLPPVYISYTAYIGARPLTFAGNALAIAGPKPFHNAVTPSAAMSFRVQSMKPEYVPCGADCSRDLIVYIGYQ